MLRPRLYTLMLDKRLEEFPYVQFHIPTTEARSGWIDATEIYPEDLEILRSLNISLLGHVTLYNRVSLYANVTVCEGSILNEGSVICPDVILQEGTYVDANEVVCIEPPSRWTKLFRAAGYFLGRFKRFAGLKPSADQSIDS